MVVTAKPIFFRSALVDEAVLSMLQWASDHPTRWHDIGKLPEFKTAAELLEKRGVIETRQPMNRAAASTE